MIGEDDMLWGGVPLKNNSTDDSAATGARPCLSSGAGSELGATEEERQGRSLICCWLLPGLCLTQALAPQAAWPTSQAQAL